jgi:hypothetical protein
MDHRTETTSMPVVLTVDDPHYSVAEIVACMRVSATMLKMADGDRPASQKYNRGQAALLTAAANDLEAQQ